MKQEINPKNTSRAQAFELWMKSPMPMVTLTKTFDVTRLRRESKRRDIRSAFGRLLPEGRKKFNLLLCWCIGRAASRMDEFYLLPEKGLLFKYDRLAINVIVNNVAGGINSCDIPYTNDLDKFCSDYMVLTQTASASCQSSFVDDAMVIGTSAMISTELDSIRYRKGWLKTTLPISFQFHHVQMDGGHAARFLDELQKTINTI